MMTRYVGPRSVYPAADLQGRLLQPRRGHRDGARHRRRRLRRFRQLPRRAGRSALGDRGAVGVHLSVRHPGQQGRPAVHRRGARHRRRVLRAGHAADLRAARRHRVRDPRREAHAHPQLPPRHPHRQAADRRRARSPSSRASSACPRRALAQTVDEYNRCCVPGDYRPLRARRRRDEGPRAGEVELGAAGRRGAVPRLPDHLRERVHVRRREGGPARRACSTATASRFPASTPRARRSGSTTATTPARPRC